MANEERSEYEARERILRLLTDEEVAKVSTAEEQVHLADGEEYVDLERVEDGVRQAHGGETIPAGRVLPRSAVRDETWSRIVSQVGGGETRH